MGWICVEHRFSKWGPWGCAGFRKGVPNAPLHVCNPESVQLERFPFVAGTISICTLSELRGEGVHEIKMFENNRC